VVMTRSTRRAPVVRVVPPELASRYREAGWWSDETLGDVVSEGLSAAANLDFRVHSEVRPYAGTCADVELLARRLAGGLANRGVRAGDVIAFQLPNWVEAAATFWASALLGAVVVPIVHFYGPRELMHIFATAQPMVFITAEGFGQLRHRPELSAEIPVTGVVGRDFDDLLAEPLAGTLATDSGNPALIAFTSGTAAAPKGVIHSHQTLIAEARQLASMGFDTGRPLTATPIGHFVGMLSALLIPMITSKPINLADVWDPAAVLHLLLSDGLSLAGGPPYFFTSILDHPDFTPEHLTHLTSATLGGSAVPAAVTARLDGLGLSVSRSYGSTEHPSVTGSSREAAQAKRLFTDGCAMPGVEVRIADDGEIHSRGPDLCLGYLDEAMTASVFDADGWYHTGDIGVLDHDGYLVITDRKSDVIIRGGENVSALEVEEVLLTMPGIAEAAVVSAPDRRLGERVAAVLRLSEGSRMPAVDEVRAHFTECGVARQKWPEELHEVNDMPRTATGKIQKAVLRQWLRADRRPHDPEFTS